MKKRLLVFLALVATFAVAIGISACGPKDAHAHDWSTAWTYDETNHWHNCNGCDQHTGTAAHEYDDDNDADCNVCGQVRHIHTYQWQYNNEYHWQAKDCHPDDEQKDKDLHDFSQGLQCPVCGFDSSGIHQHTYEWRYDEARHWEESVCTEVHDVVTREQGDHEFDPDTKLCKCGVSEAETQVYALYKSNEEYKGAEAQSFADWEKEWKAAGVHHVGITQNGDGAFYTAKTDAADEYNEEVKYFTERTVNLTASYQEGALETKVENIYFVIKCKVDGEFAELKSSKIIVSSKTDSEGAATLTFTPVFGYSSDTVQYTVSIASADDKISGMLRPIPEGYKITDDNAEKALTVSGAENEQTVKFSVYRVLGEGIRGALDNVRAESYKAVTTFFLENLEEGIYKLELKATEKGFMSKDSTFISVDGGGTQDIGVTVINSGSTDSGGGEGWFYVYITENSQLLSLRREIGEFIGNIQLTRFTDVTIDKTEHAYDLVTSGFKGTEYDISGLARGMYVFTVNSKTNATITVGGTSGIQQDTAFEIKEGDNKLRISRTAGSGNVNVVHEFTLFAIEEIKADEEKTIPFDASHKMFRYSFASGEKGSYSISLSAEGGFKDLDVTYTVNGSWGAIAYDLNAETQTLYFSAFAQKQYVFTFRTSSDDCPPVKATFHFEKAQDINLDEEFDIDFSAETTQKEFTLSVPKGLYMIKITGENLYKVTLERTGSSSRTTGADGSTIITDVFTETSKLSDYTFTIGYSGSDSYPSVKVIVETLNIGDASAVSSYNTDFTVNLSASAQYSIFSYKPSESKAEYYSLVLKSADDISQLKVYAFTITSAGTYSTINRFVSTTNSSDSLTDRTTSYSSSIPNTTTIYFVFVYDKTADYPSAITANFHYRFELSNQSYAPTSAGDYKVKFNKVEGADSYELYMASTRTSSNFEKVADFDNDDELVYTYDQMTGGYKYFYFIAKDSTGKYLDGKSATSANYAIYFESRRQIEVHLTVPEGFDNDVKFAFMNTMSGSTQKYNEVTEHIKAEPGKLTVTLSLIAQTSEACKITVTISGANSKMYKAPASTTVAKSTTSVDLVIEKYSIITVTIDLSRIENFAGGNVTATIYSAETAGTSMGSGTVNIEKGSKSATIEVAITSATAITELYAEITSMPSSNGKADEGRVKVSYNEDTKTGTVTLGLTQLPEVTVSLNFPANVDSDSYIVKFFAKTGEDVASSASATISIKAVNTAETSTVSGTAYLPVGTYVVKVTVPTNSGYSAEDTEITVSGKDDKVSVDIIDRIVITVTIEADKRPSEMVYVNVYEKNNTDVVAGSGYTMLFSSKGDKYEGTITIKVPSGKEYIVKGDTAKTSKNITFTEESADIVVVGASGTATLNIGVKLVYTINYSVSKGNAGTAYGQAVIYKNGVSFKTETFNLTSNTVTKAITLSEEEYDPNAQYAIRFTGKNGNFVCPGKIINFGDSTTVSISVTMDQYSLSRTGTVKFEVPADFEDSTSSYKVAIYEVGGIKIADVGSITFKPGQTNNLSTYNLMESDTMYWEITATDGIISTMAASKKWEASVGKMSGVTAKSVTVTIKQRAEAQFTVTAPAEFAQESDKTVTVIVLDSANKLLLKQAITVTSGTTQATATLYLPEAAGCKIIYLVDDGYTVTGNNTYTADTSAHTVEAIAVTVSKNG